MMTAMKRGFLCIPLRTFQSSKIDRAFSSLKIWQNTKALNRMLLARVVERANQNKGREAVTVKG